VYSVQLPTVHYGTEKDGGKKNGGQRVLGAPYRTRNGERRQRQRKNFGKKKIRGGRPASNELSVGPCLNHRKRTRVEIKDRAVENRVY